MRWGILSLVIASAAAWAQVDEQKPGLAVFDLKGIGTRPTEAEASSNAVVRGLRELDAFEVLSSEDLRQLLSIERQKQMLGLENDTNVTASAQALGVKNFVVGSVTRSDKGLSAELRLLDPKDNKVVSQRTIDAQPSLDKLTAAITGVVQELVGPLLFLEQGSLLVRTREEGAEVVVDDVSRGSTPLPSPLKLPRGRHRLIVKKDGFISRVTTTLVRKEQLTLEDVTLVPSADYVAAYNARNKRLRYGALVGVGVAIVGFGVALLLDRAVAEPKYQNDFKPRQDVLQAVSSGTATSAAYPGMVQHDCFNDVAGCRVAAQADASSINTLTIVSWVMVGVGVLGVVGAAYCFVSGEDPSRYAQLVASILPSGGGIVGLTGHW